MDTNQIYIQIGVAVIAMLTVTAILWGSSKVFDIFSGISIPKGAVVAFAEDACPPGWTDYNKARGRFLRGKDNEKIEGLAGKDEVILSVKNMPRHRHRIHGTDHNLTPKHVDYSSNEYGKYIGSHAQTEYAGEEQPSAIALVPEYVAVRFCRR